MCLFGPEESRRREEWSGTACHILYTKWARDKLPEARAPSVTDSRKGYEDDVIWLVAWKHAHG
jgi:hypothetical protein